MSAPDLTAVKAMLADALVSAAITGNVHGVTDQITGAECQAIGLFDHADKLATTVAAWFAARDGDER